MQEENKKVSLATKSTLQIVAINPLWKRCIATKKSPLATKSLFLFFFCEVTFVAI